ncbi:MAG TPA: bifunctional DNA primase/polymerase, partial [Polyangiaceae bacterium]
MPAYDCRPAAHTYADLGLHVVELAPLSKEPPYGSRGVYGATVDHDAIERFDPRANLAIRCGAVSGIAAA